MLHGNERDVMIMMSKCDVMIMMSKWITENIFDINIPKKHLRLPSSTWPPVASRWLHALPTQQPYHLPAK